MRAVARSRPSGVFYIGRDPFELLADKYDCTHTPKLGGRTDDRYGLYVLHAIDRPEERF
jgi:hypothetical protein